MEKQPKKPPNMVCLSAKEAIGPGAKRHGGPRGFGLGETLPGESLNQGLEAMDGWMDGW